MTGRTSSVLRIRTGWRNVSCARSTTRMDLKRTRLRGSWPKGMQTSASTALCVFVYQGSALIEDMLSCSVAHSFASRFRQTAGPGCTHRFMETMDLFFRAVAQQASDRARGDIPSLEEYVALRWDTSGCKPCFALIEYAAGIDLPDEVAHHPRIRDLEHAANAVISWSNVRLASVP